MFYLLRRFVKGATGSVSMVGSETTPGPATFSKPTTRERRAARRSEFLWILLFVSPGLLLAALFKIFPLFRGLYESQLHWESVGGSSTYVGLHNFSKMLHDPVVQETFLNALKVIVTLPVWVLFPLALAFLIFQRTPGWGFFRAVFFLPYTIAPIIVGQIWRELLGTDGPFNVIIKGIGLQGVARAWLADSNTALWAMVFVVLWTFSGLGIITYLAGFATIDEEIFDAAAIDGAGYWTKIFRIILPMMWPIVGYWTILCTGGMLLWMFPFIFAMTEGGPGHATTLPEYLVYITAFRFNERGYGTAIGVGLFFFVLIFSFFQVRYMYQGGSAEEKKR